MHFLDQYPDGIPAADNATLRKICNFYRNTSDGQKEWAGMASLTAKWDGERFENGRPKVSDDLIERLKKVTIEESWAELMKLGYQNQYEGDWELLHETEDAVLAKRGGVLFIPPHLVEHIVLTAEFTRLSDEFGEEMIKKGIYTAGQIDSAWSDEMNKRFGDWVRSYKGKLPMSREQLEKYLKDRNF